MNPGSQSDRTALYAAARADFATFVELMFDAVNGQGSFAPNWHVEAMCWQLEQVAAGLTRRLIFNLPPRHLKSFCASIAFPLWYLGRDPRAKIICISYGDSLVEDFARQRLQLVDHPVFRAIFPGVKPAPRQQNLGQIGTTRGGRILGLSIGGPITGKGCDIMIIDDPMKADESQSAAARERTFQTFRTTLFSRFNDPKNGAIVLAMQRLHIEDLTAQVQPLCQWNSLSIPARAPADETYHLKSGIYHRKKGALIQPDRYGPAELAEDRRVLGHYGFEAQYQQNPLPVEGNLVQSHWFNRFDTPPRRSEFAQLVISVDPASSADRNADYSVLSVWGVKNQHYYILDLVRGQFEYPDLKRQITQLARRWRADCALIERAGTGIALYQQFRQENAFPVFSIRPKGDKPLRLLAVSPIIEEGRVYLPREAPWLAEFLREILAFPHASHDDQTDSLSQFLNWVRRQPRQSKVRARLLAASPAAPQAPNDSFLDGRERAYGRSRAEGPRDRIGRAEEWDIWWP